MKKYILTVLVLLFTFNFLWAVKAKVKIDGLTGESSVETAKFKLTSASTGVLLKQDLFLGTPLLYCQFVYKNNKTYLIITYVPAHLNELASMNMASMILGGTANTQKNTGIVYEYTISKGYPLQIKLGDEIIEIKAENEAISGEAFFLTPITYDVSDIDFSKELITYVRTKIKYGVTEGEVGGEVKASGAKKLQKAYLNLLKAVEKIKE